MGCSVKNTRKAFPSTQTSEQSTERVRACGPDGQSMFVRKSFSDDRALLFPFVGISLPAPCAIIKTSILWVSLRILLVRMPNSMLLKPVWLVERRQQAALKQQHLRRRIQQWMRRISNTISSL